MKHALASPCMQTSYILFFARSVLLCGRKTKTRKTQKHKISKTSKQTNKHEQMMISKLSGPGWGAGGTGEGWEVGRSTITLDFTVPHQTHNCPRADGIQKKTPLQQRLPLSSESPNKLKIVQERMVCLLYSSNRPRLHSHPTGSQLSKSGWY